MKGQQRLVIDPEQQAAAERDVILATQGEAIPLREVAGGELAQLVEFAVVGQIGFGNDAQNPPAVDHCGTVEQ